MVQIEGKYEVTENKNFYELLLKFGIPEEQAKQGNEAKSVLQVEVDGNKIRLISDYNLGDNVSELILNQEVDEKIPLGETIKSTATLEGSVLTITSKGADGNSGKRILTFSDKGLEMKITSEKGDTQDALRIYKRV